MKVVFFCNMCDCNVFQTDFYDTKDLKAELEIYDTFSMEIPINKSASAVHVPTDVYKGSMYLSEVTYFPFADGASLRSWRSQLMRPNSLHGCHFVLVADGRLRASDKIMVQGEEVGSGCGLKDCLPENYGFATCSVHQWTLYSDWLRIMNCQQFEQRRQDDGFDCW